MDIINGIELFDELGILSEIQIVIIINIIIRVDIGTLPLHVLQKMIGKTFDDVYANVAIVLRTLLTLPVNTATVERTFSKLKLIKNCLRTTISEEKTNYLAIMKWTMKTLLSFLQKSNQEK